MTKENLFLLSRMTPHDVIKKEGFGERIFAQDEGWFDKVGRLFNPVTDTYELTVNITPKRHPDMWAARTVALHRLGVAHHPSIFYRMNGNDNPKPTESDRMRYIEWIEFITSFTGLLSLPEIDKIRQTPFWTDDLEGIPLELFAKPEVKTPSFEEVATKILSWKKEGWEVALFHGAFDPVTPTHITNTTWAYLWGLKTGTPVKIIAGFDNDILIKRKGKNRPRYDVEDRRKEFGAFWMVDETVVMRPQWPDSGVFASDYKELGIDFVVATNNEEDIKTRALATVMAGKYPLIIPHPTRLLSATEILKHARKRKRSHKDLI